MMHERLDNAERYLLWIAVFLSPWREFRPAEINITYSDLVFCLLVILMVGRRRLQISPMQDVTVIWMVATLCLIGGLFASSIIYGSPGDGLIVCIQYIFAFVLLPFIVLQKEDMARTLVKAMLFASLFLVVSGFIFAATGYHGNYVYVSGSGRLASFSANPNDFALMIALSTPILLYLWISRAVPSWLCLVVASCFLVGLVMASSNGGLGATVIGIVVFLLFLGRIQALAKGAVLVGIAVLLVATVGYDYLPEVFQRRVLSALESGDIGGAGTFTDRLALIHEALGKLDGSLLLGIGADQYGVQSAIGHPVHNMYLLVWVEGGTIALFGWLLILVTMAIIGIRSYQLPHGALGSRDGDVGHRDDHDRRDHLAASLFTILGGAAPGRDRHAAEPSRHGADVEATIPPAVPSKPGCSRAIRDDRRRDLSPTVPTAPPLAPAAAPPCIQACATAIIASGVTPSFGSLPEPSRSTACGQVSPMLNN